MVDIKSAAKSEKCYKHLRYVCVCVCVGLVAQSRLTLCDSMDCSLPGSSVHGDSPGKNTGMGCHAFLQGIFSTQGLNPSLPHCRRILYCLSHQVSPFKVYIYINNTDEL